MEHPYHDDNNNYNNEESTVGSRSFLGEGMDDRDPYNEEYNDDPSMSIISGQPLPRIFNAGIELESLLRAEMSGNPSILGFPPTCLPIARLLAGNHCCVDCGDEQYERLVYASLGYGSILCQECATRHSTVTPDESNIRHINNENWDLRSTLTLLEGGNTNMLEYVKNKPRWRASRLMGQKNVDSEDVLAFKQIYLSKAAATYRTNLSKKVDQVHYEHITSMRDEDAKKEKELEQMNTSPQADPFQRIFEMNNMTGDEIPGFGMSHYNDDVGDKTLIGANSMATTAGGRRRRGARNTLSASKTLNGSKTAPSADLIKQRIAMRRGMSRRNQMAAFDEDSQSQMGMSEAGYSNVGGDRVGSKAVRRHSGIGNFVGEIKSIADPYEEASVAPSVARPAIRVHGRPLPQDQQDDTSQVISKYRGRRPSQEHNIGVAYRQSIADEPAVRESQLVRLGNELATQGGRRLSIESGSQYGERIMGNGGQQERQMVGGFAAAAYEAAKYDQQARRRLSNASGSDDGGNQQLVSSYTRGPVYRQPSITN